METTRPRWLGLGVSALVLSACTSGGGGTGAVQPPLAQAVLRLVSYDSCEDALAELKDAAAEHVTPYGFGGGVTFESDDAVAGAGAAESRLAAPQAVQDSAVPPDHSTTNTHEAGVDEPDLVKTDGRRIVTVVDGTLRVVDAESQEISGELALDDVDRGQWWPEQMLLAGDRALVLGQGAMPYPEPLPSLDGDVAMPMPPFATAGSRLVLVDLSGEPRMISTLDLDGVYVDARQVGAVARLVVRSSPRLTWTYPDERRSEAEALDANRRVLAETTIEDWLPGYTLTEGAERSRGPLVECDRLSHPEVYSGTSMLTVLSVDLTESLRARGSVAVAADGQTVYGTESKLYIAGDHRVFAMPVDVDSELAATPERPRTEVHMLEVSDPDDPRYVASGQVDGWLLNQYSLSEHDDHLRIATTEDGWAAVQPGDVPASQSQVTVLARRGDRLVEVGSVGGLGKGEQIYAVRFAGPVGYVVTFRQTDPLYTLDLADPTRPRVVGELKIPGYSAYLHPAGDSRLIGVGQDADQDGRVLGSQVSLFDVGDPAEPTRLDTHSVRGGWSDAEQDPHAFLYWPDDGIVVIPVWSGGPWMGTTEDGSAPAMAGGALVLRLDGDDLTEVGVLSHVRSAGPVDWMDDPSIRRSVVIGDTLWTLSSSGALASDVDDLTERAWIPFDD